MVTGWVVSITLFVVCGLVALALAKIIDSLDRATSMAEDSEAESLPHDDQGRPALPGDATIGIPLVGGIESNEFDTLPSSIEQPDTIQRIASPPDSRSHAVNEGGTPADR